LDWDDFLEANDYQNRPALNTGTEYTWTPESSLQQGIYSLSITSPTFNPNESPYFGLVEPSSSKPESTASNKGLSTAAQVGIGLGVPLGVIVAILGYAFMREHRLRKAAEQPATAGEGGQLQWQPQQEAAVKTPQELHGKTYIPELQGKCD